MIMCPERTNMRMRSLALSLPAVCPVSTVWWGIIESQFLFLSQQSGARGVVFLFVVAEHTPRFGADQARMQCVFDDPGITLWWPRARSGTAHRTLLASVCRMRTARVVRYTYMYVLTCSRYL